VGLNETQKHVYVGGSAAYPAGYRSGSLSCMLRKEYMQQVPVPVRVLQVRRHKVVLCHQLLLHEPKVSVLLQQELLLPVLIFFFLLIYYFGEQWKNSNYTIVIRYILTNEYISINAI
jgi:hypothetical protein